MSTKFVPAPSSPATVRSGRSTVRVLTYVLLAALFVCAVIFTYYGQVLLAEAGNLASIEQYAFWRRGLTEEVELLRATRKAIDSLDLEQLDDLVPRLETFIRLNDASSAANQLHILATSVRRRLASGQDAGSGGGGGGGGGSGSGGGGGGDEHDIWSLHERRAGGFHEHGHADDDGDTDGDHTDSNPHTDDAHTHNDGHTHSNGDEGDGGVAADGSTGPAHGGSLIERRAGADAGASAGDVDDNTSSSGPPSRPSRTGSGSVGSVPTQVVSLPGGSNPHASRALPKATLEQRNAYDRVLYPREGVDHATSLSAGELATLLKEPQFAAHPPSSIPVAVVTYKRVDMLFECLRSLLSLPGLSTDTKSQVFVYQDFDGQPHAAGVPQMLSHSYKDAVTYVKHTRDMAALRKRQRGKRKLEGAAYIAAHYEFVLSDIFRRRPDAEYAIIVEEDMVFAPDFLLYFSQLAPLMDGDSSVWCVSSWNDNGQLGVARRPEALYRTDFFIGLGWMAKRSIMLPLLKQWPATHWDHWMRESRRRKGRQCVYPELSRNFNIGDIGAHSDDNLFKGYFRDVILNTMAYVKFDVASLNAKIYHARFKRRIKDATVIQTVGELLALADKPNLARVVSEEHVIYVNVQSASDKRWEDIVAPFFGQWHSIPHIRGIDQGVSTTWFYGHYIMVVCSFSPYFKQRAPSIKVVSAKDLDAHLGDVGLMAQRIGRPTFHRRSGRAARQRARRAAEEEVATINDKQRTEQLDKLKTRMKRPGVVVLAAPGNSCSQACAAVSTAARAHGVAGWLDGLKSGSTPANVAGPNNSAMDVVFVKTGVGARDKLECDRAVLRGALNECLPLLAVTGSTWCPEGCKPNQGTDQPCVVANRKDVNFGYCLANQASPSCGGRGHGNTRRVCPCVA